MRLHAAYEKHSTFLRITCCTDFAVADDSLRFVGMFLLRHEFHAVARWTVVRTSVRTTVIGRGHPEPRKRHRRRSKIERIDIRSTRAEKLRWAKLADRHKLTLSEFVRVMVNGGKMRIASVADPALIHELRRQGNNLNQLVHAINAGYFVRPERVAAAIEMLQALYRREIGRN